MSALSCNQKPTKISTQKVNNSKDVIPLPPLQLNNYDIISLCKSYDSVLISKIDFETINSELIVNIKYRKRNVNDYHDFILFSQNNIYAHLSIKKHILYYKEINNDYTNIKLIEFQIREFTRVYFYKLIVYKNKCLYFKWLNHNQKADVADETQLFVGANTDTLFSNIEYKEIKKLFPEFKNSFVTLNNKEITIDYNYDLSSEDFYRNLVLR